MSHENIRSNVRIEVTNFVDAEPTSTGARYFYVRCSWSSDAPERLHMTYSHTTKKVIDNRGLGTHYGSRDMDFMAGVDWQTDERRHRDLLHAMGNKRVVEHQAAVATLDTIAKLVYQNMPRKVA